MQPKMICESFMTLFKLIGKSWLDLWRSDAFDMGAALAYYVVFSLGPALLMILSIAGSIFGAEAAHDGLFRYLKNAMGDHTSQSLEKLLTATRFSPSNMFGSIMSTGAVVIGSTIFFSHLKRTLNRLWNIPDKRNGISGILKGRLMAFLAVLTLGFFLLIFLMIDGVIAHLGNEVKASLPLSLEVLRLLSFVLSMALLSLVFIVIFGILSDGKFPARGIVLGAVVTSFFFSVGKIALGIYLGKNSTISLYGASGWIIVVLISAYFFCQMILWGACFIQRYTDETVR